MPSAIKKTANLVRQPAHRATRMRLSLPLMRGHSPGERSNNGVGNGEQVELGECKPIQKHRQHRQQPWRCGLNLGPDWSRRFNCADVADGADAKELNLPGL